MPRYAEPIKKMAGTINDLLIGYACIVKINYPLGTGLM